MIEVSVITGAKDVQSSNQIITTKKHTPNFLQASCPSSPNEQWLNTKGRKYHFTALLTPSSPVVMQANIQLAGALPWIMLRNLTALFRLPGCSVPKNHTPCSSALKPPTRAAGGH